MPNESWGATWSYDASNPGTYFGAPGTQYTGGGVGTTPGTTVAYNPSTPPSSLNPPPQLPNTSGVGGSTTMPTQSGGVPWWLNKSVLNRNIGELRDTYKDAAGNHVIGKGYKGENIYGGGAFDVSDTVANLQQLIDSMYGTNMQNADSAAREAEARARQQGGQVNTSMVRGQVARQAEEQRMQGQAQIGQYSDEAKQKELAARASLAQAIANLRQQYSQQLSAYSLNKDQQQIGREEFYQNLGQQQSRFAASLQQSQQQLAQQGKQYEQGLSSQRQNALLSKLPTGIPTIFSSSGTQPSFAGMDVNQNNAEKEYLNYISMLMGNRGETPTTLNSGYSM